MTEPLRITSRQNERVKRAVRLRDRRGRKRQRRFLIDGRRELQRAVMAGIAIDEIFLCESLCQPAEMGRIGAILDTATAEVLHVTEHVFARLAFGARAEGLVGVARTPTRSLTDLRLPERPLVAVIEGAEKPGNVGAVLRSADSAGVDAVVLADGRTDLFHPAVVRASLGTLFHIPVCEATSQSTCAWLDRQGLVVLTASPEAIRLYTDVDYRPGTAVVLGSEAAGLSATWKRVGPTAIRLPQQGMADSLNVSVAAAVIFYEAFRQRSSPLQGEGGPQGIF